MAQDQKMGMGLLGSDNIIFKRKFRWTMNVLWQNYYIDEAFVKVAARPSLTIEETPINFLNSRMYLPGKGEWDTMTVTYYDVGSSGGDQGLKTSMEGLYSWLASVYDFTNPVYLKQSSSAAGYGATVYLRLWDGCGTMMEEWFLKKVFPTNVNFGDLDYSSSDEVNIELTLRFSEVEYKSHCPLLDITPDCLGCGNITTTQDYGKTFLSQNLQ